MINRLFSTIHISDCNVFINEYISDGSIDLILTSPEYDQIRTPNVFDFKSFAKNCWRVLKPGACLVWVRKDQVTRFNESGTSFEQALYLKKGLWSADPSEFFNMNTMFYEISNPTPNVKRLSYTPSVEYMFVFHKGKPAITNWQTEPCKYAGLTTSGSNGRSSGYTQSKLRTIQERKRMRNIWTFTVGTNRGSKSNSTPFPLELAKRHILTWTNQHGVILDPMCGSGTTLEAANITNREWIGCDINPDKVRESKTTMGIPL